MRFASLGSGSRGNSLLVESGATRLLIDAGFGPRETLAAMAVRELSFAEFRVALEKSGKRLS